MEKSLRVVLVINSYWIAPHPYFWAYMFFDESYAEHFSMSDQIWLPIFGHFLFIFSDFFLSFIFDKLAPPN